MLNPDYRDILSEFSEKKVEFPLVGAYALAVYGLPRATGDIDLWARSDRENAGRLSRALADFGAPLSEEIEGMDVPVISRRHLIMNKRAVGRLKDEADARWLEESEDNEPL